MRWECKTTGRSLRMAGVAVLLLGATVTATPKIGDITYLQGARTNKLTGMGLVVGLPGTGDGGRYAPTIRSLAALHRTFASPALSLDEMRSANNVAIVQVEATLPRDGVREGERVDVVVSSLGPAKSLQGGRLLLTPLVGPHPEDPRGVMALASGPLHLEDPEIETVARVPGGATLEQNWIHNYIVTGRALPLAVQTHAGILPDASYVTLVIHEPHAQWAIAYQIANTVNSEFDLSTDSDDAPLAIAIDPRTVVVRIPPMDIANPASFLYRLESAYLLMPATEARVTIHRPTETIIISGDVQIAPAVISHKGLTITTMVPEPAPDDAPPQLVTREWVPVDSNRTGGARLEDLVETLNQLRVPATDRITIIRKLYETGRLHATLIVED